MKTHPLNVTYLVVGLVFLGLAGSWALRETGVIDFGEVRWLLPLTLVAAGVIGLVAFAAKGIAARRGTDQVDATGGYSPDYGPDYGLDNDPDYNSEGENR